MANFNKVILAGRLTHDPELRHTPKGTAVCRLSLAVNRTWKNEAGEAKEEATFVNIETWGTVAEKMPQWFNKGSNIIIEGRLKLESWIDKASHEKRSSLKVVMESFSFVDGKKTGAASPAPAGEKPAPEEDDVPF